ncbi:hypothetical protein [Lactococcus sp. DD01]|uniref:hypothetical protein n=1 Tax=Lactococcus sp. DD01 TaxID=1776443 RepID=UPI00079C1258|nr:hypothetical protein [Lactococcus sp. DD01]KXT61669.1 hypothetical protein LACDD01_01294 [Lactococcus sp. DD01]
MRAPSSWAIVKPERDSNSALADYVTLHLGDDNRYLKIFMPTFNQNNHSADSNTTGQGREGQSGALNTDLGITMPGTHDQWTEGQKHTSTLRTWDKATEEEVLIPDVTHVAQATVQSQHGGYMTMTDWHNAGEPTGNFWVHDANGWLYWATVGEWSSMTALMRASASRVLSMAQEAWSRGISTAMSMSARLTAISAQAFPFQDKRLGKNLTVCKCLSKSRCSSYKTIGSSVRPM